MKYICPKCNSEMKKGDTSGAYNIPLCVTNDEYSDYYMLSNEKLMSYSISLIMEIDELLENGYTKDEITKIIDECDFCANDPELTKEESEYLRNYSIRTLDIRYNLYIEENNKKEAIVPKELKKKFPKNDK